MNDSESYKQVTGELDIINRRDAIEAVMNTEPVVFDVQTLESHQKTKDVIAAIEAVPSAQPEERTEERTETHACDLISRQAAINIANDLIISVSGYEQHNHAVNSYSAELMKLPSAETDLIAKIQIGINATNTNDSYSCGMRNGMRWCMSLVDDKEPLFENCPSAESVKAYTKADYIMALHKEYGCTLTMAEEAHDKALEYLRSKARMKG